MSRPEEDLELAAFQDALVATMAEKIDEPRRRQQLAADPRAAPFREYVASFDARCVEVTALLMQRWGEREG